MASKVKAQDSADKRIKIQIGVVKRMLKEVASYEKEVITNEARVQKMRDDGKDSYDIKKQEEVLAESYMMIPDSKGRLEKSILALSELIDEVGEEAADSALLQEAKTIVDESGINNA